MAKKETTKTNTSKAKKTNTRSKVKIEELEHALENVNTEIKIEDNISIPETDGVNEITNIIDEINQSEQNLMKNIEEQPENAVTLIENEIKKTEDIKKKVEKINKSQGYATTWNGMYID